MLSGIEDLRASAEFASPRVAAHRCPDPCSHAVSGTRVPTQGLPFFGRGGGRIASPAQRERPPTEGRRVRGSATRESAPHPRTPNSLNPSQNREVARFPLNSPRPAQRGEADAREGASAASGGGGVGVGPDVPEGGSAAGEGVRPRGSAGPSPLPSPRFAGRGDRNGAGREDRKCPGVATLGFHGTVKPFGALA